jgi:hypothetical protein
MAVFVWLGRSDLRLPGLQYDEALFINASLGGPTDAFVYRRLFGIPVLLMPYIGALKAYLFAPVFAVWGVSVETIRGPAILLSGLSVLLGYELGRLATGSRWLGAMLALLMATDPSFVFMSRADYGPIVLMILLKCVALIAMFRLVYSARARFAWLLAGSLLLGVFDKVSFIWIAIGLLVAAAIVYRDELVDMGRTGGLRLWSAATTLGVGLSAIGWFVMIPLWKQRTGVGVQDWNLHAQTVWRLYQRTMNGQVINEMMLGAQTMPSVPALPLGAATAVCLVLLALASVEARSRQTGAAGKPSMRLRRRSLAFVMVMFGLILLQLIITPEAKGPHHVMALWPLHDVILLLAIAVLLDSVSSWNVTVIRVTPRQIVRSLSVVGISALVAWQLAVTRIYDDAFATANRLPVVWTTAIYPLAEYVSRQSDVDAVICAQWGTCNQLFALSPEMRGKIKDLWPAFSEMKGDETGRATFDQFFQGQRTLVVLRTAEATGMQGTYDSFKRFAARFLNAPSPSWVANDGSGQAVFEVYEGRNPPPVTAHQ